VAGVIYVMVVIWRARQTRYVPVFEDWLWHAVFPFLAYGALLWAAIRLPRDPAAALFAVAGTALLLLFTGIHNSWDTVTYIAVQPPAPQDGGEEKSPKVKP
jgi:hypothetical protein